MEQRHYKAFISYRHLPLDMEYAKKLHRFIERYTIPAALRKDGKKHPGLVFRDQEELPLSSSLSASIETALDNAEYLIVVCTPDTPKSLWVLREVERFLERHDRDHVLTLLLAGDPEKSFPPQLLAERDENGEVTARFEPLAANIAAESAAKRERLFRTERLRIMASLLDCAFDTLYRRDQRYRRRLAAAGAGVVLAAALVFIGMLLNRNAEIRRQLENSLRNESLSLAELSRSKYLQGDFRGAVEDAWRALPTAEDERPYVAQAERQLNGLLDPYYPASINMDQTIEQESRIDNLLFSDDGSLLLTLDVADCFRCYDTYSGALLWEKTLSADVYTSSLSYCASAHAFLYRSYSEIGLLSETDGSLLWTLEAGSASLIACTDELFACVTTDFDWSNYTEHAELTLRRLSDSSVVSRQILDGDPSVQGDGALTEDGRCCAFFSSYYDDNSNPYCRLLLWDIQAGTLQELDNIPITMFAATKMAFSEGKQPMLVIAADEQHDVGRVCAYRAADGWEKAWETPATLLDEHYKLFNGRLILGTSITALEFTPSSVLYCGMENMFSFDRGTGETVWQRSFPAYLLAHSWNKARLAVMLSDGILSSVGNGGTAGFDVNQFYFDCDFDVDLAAMAPGRNYEDSIAAVVPSKYPGRILILRNRSYADLQSFGEESTTTERAYASPDGKAVFMSVLDHDTNSISGRLFDSATHDERCRFSAQLPQGNYSLPYDLGSPHVTCTGRAILGPYLLDPEANSMTLLVSDPQDAASGIRIEAVSSSADAQGRLFTAVICAGRHGGELPGLYLWEDGTTLLHEGRLSVPGEELKEAFFAHLEPLDANASCVLVQMGNSYDDNTAVGVYSAAEDRWLIPDLGECKSCALSAGGNLLAVQRTGDEIELFDLEKGESIQSISSSIASSSVRKLLFSPGNCWLLQLTEAGDLIVYDCASGECLFRESFSNWNLSFGSGSCYTCVLADDGRRLLIFDNDSRYTESVLFVLDTESWVCSGIFTAPFGYYAAGNELLIQPDDQTPSSAQFLSTEELVALAEEYLAREPLPQD